MPTLQEVREAMRKLLEEQGVDVNALEVGSSHHYDCQCETCWKWWKSMGLGDEQSPPFTQAQIDAETYEQAMKRDIHTEAAAKMFNVAIEDVTPEQRRMAKIAAYGVMYGRHDGE
jgi:hypothetical protein